MNNEAAIRILLNSNEYHHAKGDLPHSAASIEAFNKAIDALKAERPQGKWVAKEDTPASVYYCCSNCGMESVPITPFCPWCGAKMKDGAENE